MNAGTPSNQPRSSNRPSSVAETVDATTSTSSKPGRRRPPCPATSLDTPRAGGDDDPGETLADTVGILDERYHQAETRAHLLALLRSLTPGEREVIRLRFEEDLGRAGSAVNRCQPDAVSRLLRHSATRLRSIAREQAQATA